MPFIVLFVVLIVMVIVLLPALINLAIWLIILAALVTAANLLNKNKEGDSDATMALKHSYRVLGTGAAFLLPGIIRCANTLDGYRDWTGSYVSRGPDVISSLTIIIGIVIMIIGMVSYIHCRK